MVIFMIFAPQHYLSRVKGYSQLSLCKSTQMGRLKFLNMCSHCYSVSREQTRFSSSLETRPETAACLFKSCFIRGSGFCFIRGSGLVFVSSCSFVKRFHPLVSIVEGAFVKCLICDCNEGLNTSYNNGQMLGSFFSCGHATLYTVGLNWV